MTRLPSKPGASLVKIAVGIDGEGDRRVDAARFKRGAICSQISKSSRAVTRRGVHEAGTGILGDVLAGEQGHIEVVAVSAQWMRST